MYETPSMSNPRGGIKLNDIHDNKNTSRRSKTKIGRHKALIMLGLAATAVYVAPALLSLDQASASGGRRGGGFLGSIFGEGGNEAGAGVLFVGDPVTKKECGDCHEPYSPRDLPDGSWRAIMSNLSNHFGEDASLDDNKRRHITAYLTSNAGGRGNAGVRITQTSWFNRAHNEVGYQMRRRVKTMGKCSGCHGRGGR